MSPLHRARTLARIAHHGQTDKAGRPVLSHLHRVALKAQTDHERTVAWLHDIIEDTP